MKKIKSGQVYSLNRLISDAIENTGAECNREARLYVVSQLLDKDVKSTKNLTIGDWQTIRDDAYPNWESGEWEPSVKFEGKVARLYEEYLENQGQDKLFKNDNSDLIYEIQDRSKTDESHILVEFKKPCPKCKKSFSELYLVEEPFSEKDKQRPEESLSKAVTLHLERKHTTNNT